MSIGRRLAELYRAGGGGPTAAWRFAEAAGGEVQDTMHKILDLEDQVADLAEQYERESVREDADADPEPLLERRRNAERAIQGLLAFLGTL